jgi:hypothetical protein
MRELFRADFDDLCSVPFGKLHSAVRAAGIDHDKLNFNKALLIF